MTTKVIEHTQPSFSNLSDEQLIQQFVQGDRHAFDTLYYRYVKPIYNRVRYVIPETDVEDVTQEVFIAAAVSLPSFRGDALFSTWLRALTKNKVAEYYRKQSRKKEMMQVDMEHAEKLSGQSSTSNLEDRIALRYALNNLPKSYREVILLRFAEGMRFKEIANCLDQNPEATKSLFRRAMSALQKEVEVKNE
jgi:RNA polymerase sigma factor (sigma-70 family)